MTTSSERKFERSLELGNLGERLVSEFIKSRGGGVIPSYEFQGRDGKKAPRLMFKTDGMVIPDVDVCQSGRRRWIEIKTYHGPAYNRRLRCMVHGLQKRLLVNYTNVERESGTPVFIAVLELDTGELLVSRLASLQEHLVDCQCRSCSSGRGNCMARIKNGVYWPREKMRVWHVFGDDELGQLRKAHRELMGGTDDGRPHAHSVG